MKCLKLVRLALVLIASVVAVNSSADDTDIQGVSPGAPDRLARIGSTCPSFSWEATSDAQLYELVVYRLEDQFTDAETVDLSTAAEVLYTTIPGRASSWSPEANSCFAPGAAYAWFIRAVTDAETGEGSEWSEPRFFEVAAAPSAGELERAIEVIRRWEAAAGHGSPPLVTDAGPDAVPDSDTATVPDSGSGSTRLKSVITGTAAIRGEQPDFSGETYGVVGISASPDGAGIGAANTAGGPDLVLDGAVPAKISETGVVRSSTGIESFTFTNPDTGDLDVYVEGWTFSQQFIGSGAQLTDVDADTLDGTDGAAFATEAEAAAFVAAHATSSDHDDRYYTETELGTSGTPDAVHWNNLGGVPPGFADGIDNDTTYSFGPGLMEHNGQIIIDPAAFGPLIHTVDNPGTVGAFASIVIGEDSLPLISYLDTTNHDLKVAHCNDADCSDADTYTLDSAGWVGEYTSIAIGDDGFGLISYYDVTNEDLKVAHCDNVECSTATTYTLDTPGEVGLFTSIAIAGDGLGLISYYDDTVGDLKVAHCDNVECSSASTYTLDSSGQVGWGTSIAVTTSGRGIISYYDISNTRLKVARCGNLNCSSATTYTLDSLAGFDWTTSIALGADDRGIISYYNSLNDDLMVAHCDDTLCSSATVFVVDSDNDVGTHSSITIGTDGLGIISYYDLTLGNLKVAHCRGFDCSSASISIPDGRDDVGRYTSVAIGANGLPLVAYFDYTARDLKVVRLPYGY